MKRFLLILLPALAGSIATLAIVPLRAGADPVSETRTPGDTNCDQKLDLSDAVFTLNFLFLGTAFPPCPIADPPELVARVAALEADLDMATVRVGELEVEVAEKAQALATATARVRQLNVEVAAAGASLATCQIDLAAAQAELAARPRGLPDTGQTKCYDEDGFETPCEGSVCPDQDGAYATGCPMEGRFVDNGDGTVTDTCTGLMWQRETGDLDGDGQLSGGDGIRWCNALAYCENLSLASHDDWRMPNLRELQSIVDYGRAMASIDPVFEAAFGYYWSSTWPADSPSGPPIAAWLVGFARGDVLAIPVRDVLNGYVRAVRNAP